MRIKNFLINHGLHRVSPSISAIKVKVIKLHLQERMKNRRMKVFSFDVNEYITKINHNYYHCIQIKMLFNAERHLGNPTNKRKKSLNLISFIQTT
jgi:hypothetical protein